MLEKGFFALECVSDAWMLHSKSIKREGARGFAAK